MDELSERIGRVFSGKSHGKGLGLRQAAEGMSHCFNNAADLLEGARLLASESRPARAGALTVLALEELGKALDIFQTTVQSILTNDDELWKSFWKRFHTHSDKQSQIAELGKTLRGGPSQQGESHLLPFQSFLPGDLGKTLDRFKQGCFYVDYSGTLFVSPLQKNQDVEDIVDEVFAIAEERLDVLGELLVTPARAIDALCRAVLGLIGIMEGAQDGPLQERIAKAVREGRGDSEMIAQKTETTLRAELRKLLSQCSSASPPNYVEAQAGWKSLFLDVDRDLKETVIRDECAVLRRRLDVQCLPCSVRRTWTMLKLAMSCMDANEDMDAKPIVGPIE